MTSFSSLSILWQMLIPLVIFAEAMLELGLFIYQIFRWNKSVRCLPCIAYFVVLLTLLLSVTQGDPDEGKDAFLIGTPWIVFVIVIVLVAVHFVIALPREYRSRRNELSLFSIKEATDTLPMGICFANPDSRIILCNNRMRHLSFALCGHELQIRSDLEKALANPGKQVILKDGCYILPDGTVWQFCTQNITVDRDSRWVQMTANDVTRLYESNLRQAEINSELKEVNIKLQKMYDRMADDIKEKESLDLKVYIHDTIGRSLLTIRDIINNGEDTERKIETLQEAVSMLASNRVTAAGTMEEVRLTAKTLGVSVKTEGYLPADSKACELTAAAARECVTNCIKHAGGNEVYIRIAERADCYDITITNNGTAPDGPVKEGSGLSSLRRRIESAGGEMHTAYKPRFALLITLSAKEDDL